MKLRIRGLQFRYPDLADEIESTAMYALVVAASTYEEGRSKHYAEGFERFAEFSLRAYLRLHIWRKLRMKRQALGHVQRLRPEITPTPEDAISRIEARLDCEHHLNKLSDHHQAIVWLTHACDCSPSEVGELVHRTRANVNIQYKKAMSRLRNHCDRPSPVEAPAAILLTHDREPLPSIALR
jgi:RNA polymerase sigma factor (sigma-70 family)